MTVTTPGMKFLDLTPAAEERFAGITRGGALQRNFFNVKVLGVPADEGVAMPSYVSVECSASAVVVTYEALDEASWLSEFEVDLQSGVFRQRPEGMPALTAAAGRVPREAGSVPDWFVLHVQLQRGGSGNHRNRLRLLDRYMKEAGFTRMPGPADLPTAKYATALEHEQQVRERAQAAAGRVGRPFFLWITPHS